VTEGNFLDVIEIDGASNTSVENVRELREQVKYMPAAGKYKVYIIDEVHMLSTSAFNALLKTLEEPPPHVLFVFATTEAHKIPITILSRCQRFDLRRLSQGQISEQLQSICKQEGVKADPASLELLARSAEGSMRDGLSLLDMAVGLCGNELRVEPIREMLGLVAAAWIEDLTADCLRGRLAEALAKVEDIYARGYDLRQAVLQWAEYWHDLTLLKAAGEEVLPQGLTQDKIRRMKETVAAVDLDALQVASQTVYLSGDPIFRSDAPKLLFDLLLVKLVHGTPYRSLGSLLAGEKPAAASPKVSNPPLNPRPQGGEIKNSNLLPEGGIKGGGKKVPPQIKAILDHAVAQEWEGKNFTVTFEAGSLWSDMLKEKKSVLAEALGADTGGGVQVVIQEKKTALEKPKTEPEKPAMEIPDDPVIQQAVKILNATVKEVKKFH
jgi:DNA polymerase-3 subunit gamma/tau